MKYLTTLYLSLDFVFKFVGTSFLKCYNDNEQSLNWEYYDSWKKMEAAIPFSWVSNKYYF